MDFTPCRSNLLNCPLLACHNSEHLHCMKACQSVYRKACQSIYWYAWVKHWPTSSLRSGPKLCDPTFTIHSQANNACEKKSMKNIGVIYANKAFHAKNVLCMLQNSALSNICVCVRVRCGTKLLPSQWGEQRLKIVCFWSVLPQNPIYTQGVYLYFFKFVFAYRSHQNVGLSSKVTILKIEVSANEITFYSLNLGTCMVIGRKIFFQLKQKNEHQIILILTVLGFLV